MNFGSVRVGDHLRFRTNRELYELFNNMDVAKRINIHRFRWLGHVIRMNEDAFLRRVFDAVVDGHRRQGQGKEAPLTSLDLTNWRRCAQSRGAWREALRQAT